MRTILRKFSSANLSVIRGQVNEQENLFLFDQALQKNLSYWRDIELTRNDFRTVNCVIEVPKGTFAKRQLVTEAPLHPLTTDSRKIQGQNMPRYFQMPVLFNYGYLPQTWEGGILENAFNENLKPDNDPLDVIELSSKPITSFLPTECIILGALGLVDQSEMDWKILMLNKEEAEKANIRTLVDAQRSFGPLLDYVRTFFREYKVHEKKKRNSFLREGEYLSEKDAIEIVKHNHKEFQLLIDDPSWDKKARKFNLK